MTYKILVIDDHPETLDIISSVLARQDYKVLSARSGRLGLAIAERELPDLITVDGMMPEMNGWEVCRRVRQIPELTETPIIMFTAVDEAGRKMDGFNAGADDYLIKPTDPDELIERVETLLENIEPRNHQPQKLVPPPPPPKPVAQPELKVSAATSMMTQQMIEEPPEAASKKPAPGQLIVVLGSRGGAGTTTTAVNIATALANSGLPTTLVDLDFVQGHVAHFFRQKTNAGIQQLLAQTDHGLRTQLLSHLSSYGDNLRLLLMPPNLMDDRPSFSAHQVLDIMTALRRSSEVVVVDVGRGVTAVTRPILEQADQVLLCSQPERIGLAAMRTLMVQWQKNPQFRVAINPLILSFTGSRDLPKEAIASYLGRPLLAILPVNIAALAQAVNKGIPLVDLYPSSPTAVMFRQLALQLVKAKTR